MFNIFRNDKSFVIYEIHIKKVYFKCYFKKIIYCHMVEFFIIFDKNIIILS